MPIEKISYTSKFAKNFKKLDRTIKLGVEKKIDLFKINPRHTSLRTHKLSGELQDSFSFRVDYSYRILFVFENSNEVTFIDIRTHSIYD